MMRRSLFALLLGVLLPFAAASAQTIIGTLPFTLQNGSVADANQVMSDFNTIVAAVNANAANAGANSNISALNGLTTPLVYTSGGTTNYIGGTSGGAANAQTIAAPIPSGFTLVAGKSVTFIVGPGLTNTGPAQLNVSGTGLINVFRQGTAGPITLSGGEMSAGNLITAIYDGTEYQITGASPQSLVPPCTVIDWVGASASPNSNGPSGYVLAGGGAASRTSFASLFSCISVQGVAATTTNGSASVVVPNSALFQVGWFAGGNNISCNSTITAIPDGTHITLGANAGASGATTLTIGPYLQGDCSTTFNVPNLNGRITAMIDNGSSTINVACPTNPNTLGVNCGNQLQTLTLAQLPTNITSVNAAQSITVNPGGNPAFSAPINSATITNSTLTPSGTTNIAVSGGSWTSTNSFSANNAITVVSNNTSGGAHPILPAVGLVYKFIKF